MPNTVRDVFVGRTDELAVLSAPFIGVLKLVDAIERLEPDGDDGTRGSRESHHDQLTGDSA
jgi:hypothetical protein